MSIEAPKYEEQDKGRVSDPEQAFDIAKKEDRFHKGWFGLFGKASKERIKKGERKAEEFRQEGIEISHSDVPEAVLQVVDRYSRKHPDLKVIHYFRTDPLIGEQITMYRIEVENLAEEEDEDAMLPGIPGIPAGTFGGETKNDKTDNGLPRGYFSLVVAVKDGKAVNGHVVY